MCHTDAVSVTPRPFPRDRHATLLSVKNRREEFFFLCNITMYPGSEITKPIPIGRGNKPHHVGGFLGGSLQAPYAPGLPPSLPSAHLHESLPDLHLPPSTPEAFSIVSGSEISGYLCNVLGCLPLTFLLSFYTSLESPTKQFFPTFFSNHRPRLPLSN